MSDSHDHAFDWSGIPGSGAVDRYAGDVPDGPIEPAGYADNTNDPFGDREIGPGGEGKGA
jgi:hypothetical protein